jgi:hypothetical protein
MNRWRVGEDRGSKETDRCPLTKPCCFIRGLQVIAINVREAELTGSLWKSLEVIPIAPDLTVIVQDPLLSLGIHTMSPTNIKLTLYNE